MDIENPTRVIASATNAVSQAISFAAEKLGPVATKTVEVVAKQVHVDLWTKGVLIVLCAILAGILLKVAIMLRKKSKTVGQTWRVCDASDVFEVTHYISLILGCICCAVFTVLLAQFWLAAPTVMFNTEYATAEKFMEIFEKMK